MTLKKGFYQQRVLVLGERGSSLIEVLVSMGIGLMLSLFAVYFSAQIRNQNDMAMSKGGFSCQAHLATVMDRIRAMGHANEIGTFHPNGASRAGTAAVFSMTELVDNATLWGGTPDILDTGGAGVVRPTSYNALLIRSSMRALNALFNAGPAGCTAQDITPTYAGSLVAGDSSTSLKKAAAGGNVTTSIRIQTYDLASGGAASCPAKPLYIYPSGATPLGAPQNVNVDAFATDGGGNSLYFTKATNYVNNLGFQVSLEASVTIAGEVIRCAATERFAYQQDTSRPASPTITLQPNTATDENPTAGSNAHETNWNITVNYAGGEKGVMLFCRDRSRLVDQNVTRGACYIAGGGVGSGPGPQWIRTAVNATTNATLPRTPVALPAANETDASFLSLPGMSGAGDEVNISSMDWVPCEQMTLCGRSPAATSTFTGPDATTGVITIANRYENLRAECVMRVEAVAMDTAGNLNISPAGATYNPTQISPASALSDTQTKRPTCGNLCTAWGNANPLYSTGDYWQSGGCCQGHVACAPGVYWDGFVITYIPLSSDPPF